MVLGWPHYPTGGAGARHGGATGDLSRAGQSRLKEALQLSLHRISHDLDNEVITAIRALQPTAAEIAAQGREPAYTARYTRWSEQNPDAKLIGAVGLAIPAGTRVDLKRLNFTGSEFAPAEWPTNWSTLREQLNRRMRGERPEPGNANDLLIEIPRFARNASGGFGEQEWLIVELDASYIRDVVLPRQIALHTRAGLPVALASKELRLLRYLVDQRGRVIPREELLRNVWEYQNEVSSRTVDVHVAWLRQKLEENPQIPRHIHTIRGKGYRFLP